MELRLSSIRVKEKRERDRFMKGEGKNGFKRRKVEKDGDGMGGEGDGEGQFLLDEYESDQESGGKKGRAGHAGGVGAGNGLSAETLALMEKLGMAAGAPKEEEEEVEEEIKVLVSITMCESMLTCPRSSTAPEHILNSHSLSTSSIASKCLQPSHPSRR